MKHSTLFSVTVAGLMTAVLAAPIQAQPPKMKMTTDIPASIREI